ncbi:MAG: division/cell wall cluster transcriptional repressor MraZ [Lachnospiraceae bacterium]|nr:division/cell wall cluster transcriptional repressor MraZ [Lachnospiraceae bacterium]
MAGFLKGKFNHSVDAKGRLIIPAKLRDGLGGSFVLTEGLDGCIYGYAQEEWDKLCAQIMALPSNNPKVRELQRSFNHSGTDVDIDSQGRIVVPLDLREKAEVVKDVVVAGNGNKVEIWSKERYDALFGEPASLTDLMADLSDLGLELNF